jgi:Leu/Phe-tRNA-protein transferase
VIAASRSLARAGIEVFDVQFATPHLRTLGVRELSRDDYLARVARASRLSVDLSRLQLNVD